MRFSTAEVDQYIASAPDVQSRILSRIRAMLSDCDAITEVWAWSRPCYQANGKHICYLVANKNDVNFGFDHGAHFDDPTSALKGTGANMRHLKFKTEAEIDEQLCRSFINQSIARTKS